MNQKLVSFSVADLAARTDEIAAALTEACRRSPGYVVRGLCQVEDIVHFVLLSLRGGEQPAAYILAFVDDVSEAGLTAMLAQRWASGFDAVGTVALGDGAYLTLFAKSRDNA